MVNIGSLAVKDPETLEEWLMEFGADHFFIGADLLNENVKISGWPLAPLCSCRSVGLP